MIRSLGGKPFGGGQSWAAMFMTFTVSAAMFGCDGGADQTTGKSAMPDPAVLKQQEDQQAKMREHYAKNPLSKTKPR